MVGNPRGNDCENRYSQQHGEGEGEISGKPIQRKDLLLGVSDDHPEH